jgi:hypothetical protein
MLCLLLVCATSTWAQSKDTGRGQGAIGLRESTPLYKSSEGDPMYEKKFERLDAVAGITTLGRMVMSYQFEDENGRIQVLALSKTGVAARGWMYRTDLSPFFSYECGCGLVDAKCSPHVLERFHYKWNICFEEARDKKLAELEKAPLPVPATTAGSGDSAETRLQKLNDIFKKGLITKEEYDKKKAEILKSM